MAKMFNKSECEYKGGYIVHDGEIVNVNRHIIEELNALESDVQKAIFDEEHKMGTMVSSFFDGREFSRKSEHCKSVPVIEPDTPKLDKMAEKTLKIMEEIDLLEAAEKANEYLGLIGPALEFAENDFVVSSDDAPFRFDLPTLGNPLELTVDAIVDWVKELV